MSLMHRIKTGSLHLSLNQPIIFFQVWFGSNMNNIISAYKANAYEVIHFKLSESF